jgi:predicted aspartyl protease
MHQKIEKIKKNETKPFIIKSILNKKQIKTIQNLYKILPIEINNTRQKIIKKKWITKFNPNLQEIIKKKNKKKDRKF